MRFNNIRILTNDFDKSFRFYNDILGLECTWGKIGDNFASFNIGIKSGIALFKSELMNAAIGQADVSEDEPVHDKMVIVVQVDDINESYDLLKSKGLEFVTEPKEMAAWGISVVHFRDPENNLIELYSELSKEKWDDHLIEDQNTFQKGK